MRLLVSNIGTLAGVETAGKLRLQGGEMKTLGQQDNAWLLAENGEISAFGSMEDMPSGGFVVDEEVDARGGTVLPSWCDPHTHIVYAGSREGEFVDKIMGLSYAEIARRASPGDAIFLKERRRVPKPYASLTGGWMALFAATQRP